MNIKNHKNHSTPKFVLSRLQKESIIAGSGIALEYYSVFLFGYTSFIILPFFFRSPVALVNGWISILEAIMGVIGAIICGHVGDTLGRKKILVYTIAFVALPPFLISILPGYDHIGIIATAAFIIFRLIQMFAFGGDMIGLVTFILEDDSATKQRGKLGGYMSMCAGIGAAIASLNLYLVDPFSDPTSFWKWRLILIFGVIGMLVANYLKKTLGKSDRFSHYQKEHHKRSLPPLVDVMLNNKLSLLRVLGITLGCKLLR